MKDNDRANILMVDDQPGKLMSYEAILGTLGENLIKARSAREALDQLLRNDIAVVLMDVSMPEIDGFELAEMMRQHPRFQKTAIIFISAVHLTDLDRIKGYRSGAVDYISVPVIPELLRAKVSVFAELHRKNRQLERLNSELEKRVEDRTAQIRENEDLLRERADLLELATEAIIVRDMNGTVLFWNSGAEALYGWQREEVLGKPVHQVLQTRFPTEYSSVQATLAQNGKWEGNLTQTTRDGHEVVVACRKALKADGNAILEINRDITAQLKTEDALRKTERLAAMGRVAGIIAHEINNPLEAITNTFYLLRDHPSLDEEARYYAKLGEEELRRVAHITRQTLGFYRESKHPVQVSISGLLDEILELQTRRMEFSNITLRKEYRSGGTIQGFPVELKQVFLNLIGNAAQAMPEGGTMRLHVFETTSGKNRHPSVCISICDTGAGIEPEHAKHLFEPFFTTKSTKGTGLGLWISKGIIQKYGGTIRFRTLALTDRKVTCFQVTLPNADLQKIDETIHFAPAEEVTENSHGR
ncbi:ATP-binding protein [Edaphobacter paludis]|uniref:histidine kinase n=1 Tax=Edaphobacter paludis TaxID=3035702 RepID=A0AAU7D8B3_9BACT